MKNKQEKSYAAHNRFRRAAYILCMTAVLVLMVGVFVCDVIFPLPARYTSIHPVSTVPPLMGFSADSVFNTGDAAALDVLPGIGEVLSQRIIDGRAQWGGYVLPTDLLLVKGIGVKTLQALLEALPEPLVPLTE